MKIIIDRFEEDLAVCEKDDGTLLTIPKLQLPEGAKVGDVLVADNGTFMIDPQATTERKAKISDLMKDLWE